MMGIIAHAEVRVNNCVLCVHNEYLLKIQLPKALVIRFGPGTVGSHLLKYDARCDGQTHRNNRQANTQSKGRELSLEISELTS